MLPPKIHSRKRQRRPRSCQQRLGVNPSKQPEKPCETSGTSTVKPFTYTQSVTALNFTYCCIQHAYIANPSQSEQLCLCVNAAAKRAPVMCERNACISSFNRHTCAATRNRPVLPHCCVVFVGDSAPQNIILNFASQLLYRIDSSLADISAGHVLRCNCMHLTSEMSKLRGPYT